MNRPAPPILYTVDLLECTALLGVGQDEVVATFRAALRDAGATIVAGISHTFPETGLTCVCILSESHAVLHTWPETGTVNVDIFSCSPRLRSLEVIDDLHRAFGARRVTVQEVTRADGHRSRPNQSD